MDYLKEYGLSDEDIKEVHESLSYEDWVQISSMKSVVREDIEYFLSLGITNIKDILMGAPYMFYHPAARIKRMVEECQNPDIVELLKEDPINFDLL